MVGKTLQELYRIFGILNEKYYDNKLPDPVITIQKTRPNNLGHFTLGKVWQPIDKESISDAKYEININPLNLNRSVEQIVGTLHHEMVHYDNKLKEVKDCSGQVHNRKFKESAERVGLICEKSKSYGWGFTTLCDDLNTFIQQIIKPDEKCFEYFRAGVSQLRRRKGLKRFLHISALSVIWK